MFYIINPNEVAWLYALLRYACIKGVGYLPANINDMCNLVGYSTQHLMIHMNDTNFASQYQIYILDGN